MTFLCFALVALVSTGLIDAAPETHFKRLESPSQAVILCAGTEPYLAGLRESSPADTADLYFLQGKWQKAADAYEAIAEPSLENLNRLADAYFYLDNYDAAEKTLNRALKINDNPDSIISLAMLRAVRKKKYLSLLKDMLKTLPDNPRLWRALAMAYMKNSSDKEALEYFKAASKKDPKDYISYFYMGVIYETNYAFDDAITVYKKALEINPLYAQALNNLAYSYKERHYYTYAIEMYKKALEIDPDNAGFYYNIGNAYAHKLMVKEAYDSYKRAIELDPTFAKAHYNMGRTYIKLEMFKEAVEELKLYVKYWDQSVSLHDAPHPETVQKEIEEIEMLMKAEDEGGKTR